MNTKTNKKTKKNKTKKVKFEKITNYIINLSEKEKNVLCKSSTLSFSNFESISLNNTNYNNKLLHFIVKEHETYSINLQKHNYYVYPGEQDRFGWLTGCIDTSKGTIVYG
jgi:transketolase